MVSTRAPEGEPPVSGSDERLRLGAKSFCVVFQRISEGTRRQGAGDAVRQGMDEQPHAESATPDPSPRPPPRRSACLVIQARRGAPSHIRAPRKGGTEVLRQVVRR